MNNLVTVYIFTTRREGARDFLFDAMAREIRQLLIVGPVLGTPSLMVNRLEHESEYPPPRKT
jgi:hypothetical protein